MTRSARRQYGEGNISAYSVKRGGVRYRVQWYELDLSTGENRRLQKGGFPTKREAATFLRERSVAARRGETPALRAPSFGDFASAWLDGHRAAPSTLAGYRRLNRLHIAPYIGAVPLNQLTSGHLARLYRTLEQKPVSQPGRPEKTLGANTVRKVHQLISVVLSAAAEEGHVSVNVASAKGAKPPTTREIQNQQPRIRVWEPATLVHFYSWAQRNDPDLYSTWRFIGETGVRRGEALGLRWQDVDLNKQEVTIRQALVTVKHHGEKTRHLLQPPKNARPRKIAISTSLTRELAAEHERQESQGLADQLRPVLVMSSGHQLLPESLSRRWREAVRRFAGENAGAPAIPLHGLRHTHASHLLAAGVGPKIVQERLGHETFKLTMDTYSHLLEDGQQQAVALLAEFHQSAATTRTDCAMEDEDA